MAATKKAAPDRRRRQAPGKPTFQPPEPLIEHPHPQANAIVRRSPLKATLPAAKTAAAKASPAKRAAKRAAKPEPAAEKAPELDPSRPQEHRGIAVVREELRSNLPSGAPYKISVLHLEDGTRAFACRDCLFTGDTMTDAREHRNAEHGARFGKPTPKVKFEKDPDPLDLVLPPRGDKPAPTNPMEMTLAEILALAPSYAALGDLIDRLERERDAALDKYAELAATNRDAQHALAVYPTLQQEVVELRLMVRNVGTFEELKAEVLALRAWKKKTTANLERAGFRLADEDSKE